MKNNQNNQRPPRNIVTVSKIYDYDPDLSSRPIISPVHAVPEKPETKVDGDLMCFEQVLNLTFRGLMMLACLLLAILIFTQVVTRYFMDASFNGIEETSVLLAVWVYFLGMGYATREHEHIHGGIVSLVVKSPKKIAWIRLVNTVLCMLAACFFGYFAYTYAMGEISRGKVSATLRWPRGLWSASMIVGFAMMIGYFLLEAINQYRSLGKISNLPKQESLDQSQPKFDCHEG